MPEELDQPMRRVGRYVVHAEIASGGMASVHLGRMRGEVGFARTVAIKRLHAQYAKDPDFVAMFIDEARLASRIRHPNVVPVLDVVSVEGELLLAMEYVQGEALARLLRLAKRKNERVPTRISAAIMIGVLEGLHAAHEAVSERGEPLGIVHRDVSPHNVMVGIDGLARVFDFGIAKAAYRVQVTSDGILKGKIAYMAPEQLRGGLVDRRTDVYSASAVLWETIVGRRLFDAKEQVEVFGQVLNSEVKPPSSLVPDVSAALDEVVMKGLSRDPTLRYQTAQEMATALERATPIASPREVGRWVDGHASALLKRKADLIAEVESQTSEVINVTDERKRIAGAALPTAESSVGSLSRRLDSVGGASAGRAPPGVASTSAPAVVAQPGDIPVDIDELLEPRRPRRKLVLSVVGGALALLVLGFAIRWARGPAADRADEPNPPAKPAAQMASVEAPPPRVAPTEAAANAPHTLDSGTSQTTSANESGPRQTPPAVERPKPEPAPGTAKSDASSKKTTAPPSPTAKRGPRELTDFGGRE